MQGNPQVLEALNRALTVELTAINQYFCQAKMCKNWGYMKLANKHYEESLGEMKHAEVLTGPLPVYPELLRQAGVQGRVVLEAVVDTTGRVLAASILVVSSTNPGFVAPARQALLATLFRPAMVGGKPVRMRVRIPYEFAIRNGIGRAR